MILDIERIVKKQRLLQKLMKQRREQFLHKCMPNHLYKNYIKNRYFHEEYRNEFEIGRIWDEFTFELFELIQKLDYNNEMRATVLQILTQRCEEISIVLKPFGLEHEQHLLKESLNILKTRYIERLAVQNQLIDEFWEGKREREFYFMELMVEMMDTAERLSKNRKRGESCQY